MANIGNLLLVVCKLCVNSLVFETSIDDIQFLLFVCRVKKQLLLEVKYRRVYAMVR